MDTKTKKYTEMRNYIIERYGVPYMSAIAKLSAEKPYDDNEILRPELVLSELEQRALLFFIPDMVKSDNPSFQINEFGEIIRPEEKKNLEIDNRLLVVFS